MSIVINTKTYNFDGITPAGVNQFVERSSDIASGFSVLGFSNRSTVGKGDKPKSTTVERVQLSVPVLATADSACGCIGETLYTFRFSGELEVPVAATGAQRTDVQARLTALFANTQVVAWLNGYTKPAT